MNEILHILFWYEHKNCDRNTIQIYIDYKMNRL